MCDNDLEHRRGSDRRMADSDSKVSYRAVVDWIIRIITGLIFVTTTLAFGKLNQLNEQIVELKEDVSASNERIAEIEGNRLTIQDGAALQHQIDLKPDRSELQARFDRLEDLLLDVRFNRQPEPTK